MKLVYPEIDHVFDTENEKVNCIIIENQKLLFSLLEDLENQFNGADGKLVVSENNKPLKTDKALEVLSQFVPFELNRKNLLSKISAELERKAVSEEHYTKTLELIGELEAHLMNIAFDFSCDINYNKLDIGSVIKASGVEINNSYASLGEKIIDYMELVTEFDRKKLFLTVNLRSYISDHETSEFMKTLLSHGYHVIMVESSEHPRLEEEFRYIIDADLCEICN